MKSAIASSWSTARCASPGASPARSTSSRNSASRNSGLTRRALLGGASAALVAPALIGAPTLARAAGGTRRFDLIRDGDVIGSHSLSVTEQGDAVTMTIRIDIAVRALGIRLYVYEHENRETWRNGRLVALESRTNDDGDDAWARVRADGERLMIEGSGYQGPAPLDAAPTSYWNFGALDVRPWFSTQSGEVLALSFDRRNTADGTVCSLSGDFATTLIYDSEREWRGCRFAARGADIVYEQTAPGPRFNALL